MAAFERVNSGIPQMDEALDNIIKKQTIIDSLAITFFKEECD